MRKIKWLGAVGILLLIASASGQTKPVVAFLDFYNNTPIDVLMKNHSEYVQLLSDKIDENGLAEVRTADDIAFINQLREELQLGLKDDDDPVVKLLTLPRDKFGTLLQQGADYLGFGVWVANDNMIFKSASLSLNIFLVNVETRETITVSKAIDNDAPVTCVSFTSDGSCVGVGNSAGQIYVYELRGGSVPISIINAHSGSVESVHFQPSRSRVFSGSTYSKPPMSPQVRKVKGYHYYTASNSIL